MTGLEKQTDDSGREWRVTKERYWMIRKPDAQGLVIAQGEHSPGQRMPMDLHESDSLIVTYPGSANALVSASTIAQNQRDASISDDEWELLDRLGYPDLR